MISKRYDPTPPWETYEVVLRNADGALDVSKRPYSAALGDEDASPLTKMWMVGNIGWPEARFTMKDDNGRPRIVEADSKTPKIWRLKCKPGCWRLYFYVDETKKRIIYLHAKCKKGWKVDAQDAKKARRLFEGIRPGGHGIYLFDFPPSA